jgi:hypothetical protein
VPAAPQRAPVISPSSSASTRSFASRFGVRRPRARASGERAGSIARVSRLALRRRKLHTAIERGGERFDLLAEAAALLAEPSTRAPVASVARLEELEAHVEPLEISRDRCTAACAQARRLRAAAVPAESRARCRPPLLDEAARLGARLDGAHAHARRSCRFDLLYELPPSSSKIAGL